MNRLSAILAKCIKLVSLLILANAAQSAEYFEVDDFPQATSIVFTENAVGLTVVPNSYFVGYNLPDESRYFVAYRPELEFHQVEQSEYKKLTVSAHVEHRVDYRSSDNFEVETSQDCAEAGYRWDSAPRDIKGRVTVKVDGKSYEVELLCQSAIPHAIRFGDDLWIGTAEHGGHGYYGSEGILVVSGEDGTTSYVDVGFYPVLALVKDPWSLQVWGVTEQQIARMGNGGEVLARYWKYHDFDSASSRPDIFVTDSDEPIKDHPLALLARRLGTSSYKFLADARARGVTLAGPEPMYVLAMFGNYMSHQPQWPEELAGALEYAQPTLGWRKFACLLPGDNARELCTTNFGEWPRVTDTYLEILKDRYPGFSVTGPVPGPGRDENLRSSRHSPQNFADDILFGDFDSNGVLDFAAVLMEQTAPFDPHQDKEPNGFVVVCNGKWSLPKGRIEYSCSDLTEREPGGFRAELDYVDWTPWADSLVDQTPRSGDRFCSFMLQTNPYNPQTRKGNKKLSIMSSFGHCNRFFYHMDGTYRVCQYCAD